MKNLTTDELKGLFSGATMQGAQIYIGAHDFNQTFNYHSAEAQPAAAPDCLQTPEAKDLLAVFVEHGWMDERMQSPLPNTQRAVVAMAISQRLDIKHVWSVFGKLWGISPENLRSYYNRALDQEQTLSFQDEIKAALR